MKIGILTHHYINNFGAFLQAYALQEALKELFPDADVEIINYINVKHFLINTCGWFRFYRDREDLKGWFQKIRLPRTFSAARKRSFSLSRRCFTVSQVNKLGFDCIIVGSDEVWNYEDFKGRAKIKFGIGLNCKKLIAYAPCLGNSSAKGEIPEYVREGLKRFYAISARDGKTAQLVKRAAGRTAVRVLDPTFLISYPRVRLKGIQKPYILFYYCEKLPAEIHDRIFDYAQRHDMAVYGAGECDRRYTRITVDLTPFEWMEMFRQAACVYTGTFHGTVFSILNERQFRVYLTNESRIKKVRALLSEFQIQNRELSLNEPVFPEGPEYRIDYGKVKRMIEEKRFRSLEYLKKSILES